MTWIFDWSICKATFIIWSIIKLDNADIDSVEVRISDGYVSFAVKGGATKRKLAENKNK